ncbi:MAG: hypothetical protein A3E87_09925 [Gammaproteobacteria bacterium RIFCSPHIGHO2_12_FULL_35_23]|nr:MAG: hypothetical protein A3E87_09925 [Gammaproteobacteria bacterium RIFCSPHIGHO2_12_FULL_35_23]
MPNLYQYTYLCTRHNMRIVTSHTLILIWNLTNNSLIYYNTLDRMLPRLNITVQNLSEMEGFYGNLAYGSMLAALVIFSLGNQETFPHRLQVACWPFGFRLKKHSRTGWLLIFWEFVRSITAVTRTIANSGSAAIAIYPFAGRNGAITSFTVAASINIVANVAFYRQKDHTPLACIPEKIRNPMRLIISSLFALLASLLYAVSLNLFFEHLKFQDYPSTECKTWEDILITGINIIGLIFLSLATMNRYNKELGEAMGETKASYTLPQCFTDFASSAFVMAIAIFFKSGTAASSGFALFYPNKALAWSDALVGIIPAGLAQWAQLKTDNQEPQLPLLASDFATDSTPTPGLQPVGTTHELLSLLADCQFSNGQPKIPSPPLPNPATSRRRGNACAEFMNSCLNWCGSFFGSRATPSVGETDPLLSATKRSAY